MDAVVLTLTLTLTLIGPCVDAVVGPQAALGEVDKAHRKTFPVAVTRRSSAFQEGDASDGESRTEGLRN